MSNHTNNAVAGAPGASIPPRPARPPRWFPTIAGFDLDDPVDSISLLAVM